DDALARLDAVGAGIHAERPADAARNAMVEVKAADAGLVSERGDALVGRSRSHADAGRRDDFRLAKTFGREADDEARYAAFAHEQVRADADDGERNVLGHGLEEGGEVVLVSRLIERLG